MSNQHKIAVVGSGNIGTLVALMLDKYWDVTIFDLMPPAEFSKKNIDIKYIALRSDHNDLKHYDTIVNCAPHSLNQRLIEAAIEYGLNYCDLSEDVSSLKTLEEHTKWIKGKNEERTFIPCCGLAPGFIQIIANQLMKEFYIVQSCKMRVGALPVQPTNKLGYALTWSTDGLINECANLCAVKRTSSWLEVEPLEELEHHLIEGVTYEAFTTSGGRGTLGDDTKILNLDYKTLRYPGHRDLFRFLMNDMNLRSNRPLFKHMLEQNIPTTTEDKVIVHVEVLGRTKYSNKLEQKTYSKVMLHGNMFGRHWTAIQLTTAGAAAAAIHLLASNNLPTGFIKQEDLPYNLFMGSEYVQIYKE